MKEIMKISSQEFTKNGRFEILEKFAENTKTSKVYKLKLKCVKCGDKIIVRQTHKERCKCANCRKHNTDISHIGEVHGCYKILDFDHSVGDTRYYKVLCENCNSISIKTYHNILSNNQTCRICKGNSRKATLQAPRNVLLKSYKDHAVQRGLDFNLTDEEFDSLIFSKCYYCGSEPTSSNYVNNRINRTKEEFKVTGIDRINSDLGYTIDNCVPCCKICNKMKLNYSDDFFKAHITKIYNHYIVNKGSTTIENTSEKDGSEQSTHKCVETGNILIQDDDIV